MANITFGTGLDNWNWLNDFYDEKQLTLVSKTATKAVYRDANGDQIVLTGSGFAFTGSFATKGTVTGAQFISGSGEKFLTITGGTFKASDVFAEIKNKAFFDLLSVLTSGSDVIKGTDSGNDIIIGTNKGNDKIYGLGGDDFIKGSAGSDFLDGGVGWNTLSYMEAYYHRTGLVGGVTIDVAKGTAKNPWGGTDTFKNFREFEGSHLADRFTGGSGDDTFLGMGGRDTFIGGGGSDEVRYNKDAQYKGTLGIVVDLAKGTIKDGFGTVDTVKSIERVIGTQVADIFIGDAANNQFYGLKGKDSFDGGAGSDTVSFDWWQNIGMKGVAVDLRKTSGQIANDGFGNTETVKSIENIHGSRFNDTIVLGNAKGGVWGNDGNDRLVAGAGENWLEGGRGADKFVFLKATDSAKGTTTRDFIEDFSRTQGDKIDLSAFDGLSFAKNVKTMVNTAGDTVVTVDVAGSTDLQFLINGNLALKFTDFIF